MSLPVTYQYLLSKAESSPSQPRPVVLDYGCGNGEVVQEGRKVGINIYGTDVFYAGSDARTIIRGTGLFGTCVKEIENGVIPFESDFFDLVVSNQVIEHVHDLDGVLKEIHRVLKPGGAFLSHFPTHEVIPEGHIGIPFIHWFSKDSKIRYYYALALRRMGMGYFKGEKSAAQWTRDQIDWVDRYTHYRSLKAINKSYQRFFSLSFIEPDYMAFRMKKNGHTLLQRLYQLPLAQYFGHALFRRLAGVVIMAQKREPTAPTVYSNGGLSASRPV